VANDEGNLGARSFMSTDFAQAEQFSSDKLLQIVFEKAAVGFSLTDRNGRFLSVNRGFAQITGYSERELLGRDFHSITHSEDLPANLKGMQRLLTGEIDCFICEERYITKSGQLVWIQNSVAVIPDQNGSASGFVALTENITERKQADARLREREDRYRDLVEHSQDLICTHDLQGILLSVNEPPLRILGYTREELLNRPLRDFVTVESRSHCDAYLAQIRRDGFAKGLLPVLTKGGEVRLWEFNNSLRTEGVSFPVVRGLARDVTDQKRAEAALRKSEEELRQLTSQLLQLQDEERRKIARDLHDTTSQNLAALITLLGLIAQASGHEEIQHLVSECEKLAAQSLKETRTLSYVLFPPMLEEAGIKSAIRDYLNGFMDRTGITVELEASAHLGRMSHDIELAVFRVVQESLVNIQRHSGSRTAKIRLDRQQGFVSLEVSDRGRGMLKRKLTVGVGIASMTERVKHFGGMLNIESGDMGTTVRVRIPINESKR